MILSARQSRTFFRVFNAFCHFAAERLGIGPLRTYPGGAIMEDDILDVCEAVWGPYGDRSLVDAFLGERIAGINRTEQRLAAGWGEAVQGLFCVQVRAGDTYFVQTRHAFAVRGITREPCAGLSEPPLMVEATLLPFDGVVTYAINLLVKQIELGPGMRRTAEETLDAALDAGLVVRTERQFLRAAPDEREWMLQQEATALAEETEEEMNADVVGEGQHVGALAMLPWDERERVVAEHARRSHDGRAADAARHRLDALCRPGAPERGLEGHLASLDADSLASLALWVVPEDVSGCDRAGVERLVFDSIAEDGYGLMSMAIMRGRRQVADVRTVMREGGSIVFSRASVTSLEDQILPVEPVLALYRVGSAYVASIPDEMRFALERLDFDELLGRADEYDAVMRYLEVVCDARGIVEMGEAIAACAADLEVGEAADDLVLAMRLRIDDHAVGFGIVELDGVTYLACEDLAVADEAGRVADPDEEAMVRWVLSRHETIEARPMLDVFSAYGDAFAWKLDRESARALARYFDERVPDGADDYRFGDDVVRLVPPLSQMKDHGESINVFFEGIDALGFRVSQAQLNPILALFVDFVNNLPRWCNNGWTSEELYERYGR